MASAYADDSVEENTITNTNNSNNNGNNDKRSHQEVSRWCLGAAGSSASPVHQAVQPERGPHKTHTHTFAHRMELSKDIQPSVLRAENVPEKETARPA